MLLVENIRSFNNILKEKQETKYKTVLLITRSVAGLNLTRPAYIRLNVKAIQRIYIDAALPRPKVCDERRGPFLKTSSIFNTSTAAVFEGQFQLQELCIFYYY